MKNIIILAFLIVGSLFIGAFFIFKFHRDNYQSFSRIRIDDVYLDVELAKSPAQKILGLSGRESLQENQGMLFIFDKEGIYTFWMKDMKFSIDIIWIGEGMEVVDITRNISPDSFPQQFKSKLPSKYVLEVNAGWAESRDVEIGDIIKF